MKPDDPFPSISNFAAKLFQESHVLEVLAASYLDAHGVNYDRTVLDVYAAAEQGKAFPDGAFERGPLRSFVRLEADDWKRHNVETLFEHAWATFGGAADVWDDIVYNGIYLFLFHAFTEQFGLGPARSINRMHAGTSVADALFAGDRIIDLNYDILVDLALQQSRKIFSYSPNSLRDSILLYKPHGSFNLYDCREFQRWGFSDPSNPGVGLDRHDGGTWSPSSGILPPRLNKQYAQHPIAERILAGLNEFEPQVVTFWGVGLTASDVDLLDIYRHACGPAKRVEFINPDPSATVRAAELLGVRVKHYWPLEQWVEDNGVEWHHDKRLT